MDPRDLYLLQDGTHANPSDVEPDKKGVLRHKNGLAVCLYADGSPQTVGKDAEVNKNVEAVAAGKDAAAAKANEPVAAGDRPVDAMMVHSDPPQTPQPGVKID